MKQNKEIFQHVSYLMFALKEVKSKKPRIILVPRTGTNRGVTNNVIN